MLPRPFLVCWSHRRQCSVSFRPGNHGSTFGGNSLACAIARESLAVLLEENLVERAHRMGSYFTQGIRDIRSPHVRAVRGKGLLLGVELELEAGPARCYSEMLMERGMLCKETHEHVIRFAPPLVIERQDIDWALEQIREVLAPTGRANTATPPHRNMSLLGEAGRTRQNGEWSKRTLSVAFPNFWQYGSE